MDNSLSKEATDWREGRRLRAFELKQQGWSQQRIAEALGVSKGAVSQWMKRARQGGVRALNKAPTRPRSTAALGRGAARQGTRASRTGSRSSRLSGSSVDVREGGYSDPKGVRCCLPHPAHGSRLLKALRQSLQKPQRRANQRDEEATIEHWKEERWPSLKKRR